MGNESPDALSSLSLPAGRYAPGELPNLVRSQRLAAAGIEREIAGLGATSST